MIKNKNKVDINHCVQDNAILYYQSAKIMMLFFPNKCEWEFFLKYYSIKWLELSDVPTSYRIRHIFCEIIHEKCFGRENSCNFAAVLERLLRNRTVL